MDDLRGHVIGSYRVVDRLGEGGMGTVWRARDEQLERDVAIKMLRSDVTEREENTARLVLEARAAACIKSRHVAQVLQLGTTDAGEPYVVMELLEGRTLLDVLSRERTLPAARAAHIARQIARAMSSAHALGIVHRDLKPANVMLVDDDAEGEVAKVLDFGIAKRTHAWHAGDPHTGSGVLLGTLHFMSPEQIEGKDVDERADIYALGVLLYRMLTGRVVFEALSLRELTDLVVFAIPRPVTDFVAIPRRLNEIVMRCLAKRPDERFASMLDVEAALASAFEPQTAAFAQDDDNRALEAKTKTDELAVVAASIAPARAGEPTTAAPVDTPTVWIDRAEAAVANDDVDDIDDAALAASFVRAPSPVLIASAAALAAFAVFIALRAVVPAHAAAHDSQVAAPELSVASTSAPVLADDGFVRVRTTR